jgi:methylated-DNA-[protein]-cysteine S-methyltransferase
MQPHADREISTRFGCLYLRASRLGLTHIRFERPSDFSARADAPEIAAHLDAAQIQLEDYAAGRRPDFDLQLDPRGTPFQHEVWRALREVAFGTVCSYGEIARRIGRPKAVRAVGAANGANPLPIVVPCHRIVGAKLRLTGYAGGLDRKRALLAHEGVHCDGDRVILAPSLW